MAKFGENQELLDVIGGTSSEEAAAAAAASRHSYLKLSDEQIFQLRDAFQLFDQDSSGTIETTELQAVLGALGMNLSQQEIEEMVAEVDGDGSGSINFPEFVLMMADRMQPKDKVMTEMGKALKAFDPDSTGKIQAKKFVEVMLTMGDQMGKMDTEEMMALVGVFDGEVDYRALIEIIGSGSQNETHQEKHDSLDINGDGFVDEEEMAKARNFERFDIAPPKTANVEEHHDSD